MSSLRNLFTRTINGLKQLYLDYLSIGSMIFQGSNNTISNVYSLAIDNATGTDTGLYIAGTDPNTDTNIIHLYNDGSESYLDMNCAITDHLNFRRWTGTAWTGCGHVEFTATPHINFPSGGYYSIQATDVLNYTTLGSSVINSSLQTLGILQGQPLQNADGYLQTGYLSSESSNRTFFKIETNRSNTFFRLSRGGTSGISTMQFTNNFYRDISGNTVRDDPLYDATYLQFLESGIITLGYLDATNVNINYLACDSSSNLSTFSTNLSCAGNVNIATGKDYLINNTSVLNSTTLGSSVINSSLTSIGTQTNGVNIATGQAYKINNVNCLTATALGSSVLSSSLTSVGTLTSLTVSGATNCNGGLATQSWTDSNNTRSYIKMRTPTTTVYSRICHFANTGTADTRFNLNYNSDLLIGAKDSSTLGACELVFEQDGNINFRNANSTTSATLTRCGVLPNGRFYVVSTTDSNNYFPIVSSTYIQRVASGKYTGGAATGTVNFGVTYSAAPIVTATIEVNSTNLYTVMIHTINTTSFQFRKRFYDGVSINDATAENFFWQAIGSM